MKHLLLALLLSLTPAFAHAQGMFDATKKAEKGPSQEEMIREIIDLHIPVVTEKNVPNKAIREKAMANFALQRKFETKMFNKVFTPEEIKATYDFYNTPIGRSIAQKQATISLSLVDVLSRNNERK